MNVTWPAEWAEQGYLTLMGLTDKAEEVATVQAMAQTFRNLTSDEKQTAWLYIVGRVIRRDRDGIE